MKWIDGLTEEGKRYKRTKEIEDWCRWHSKWKTCFAYFPVVVGTTEDNHKIKVWWQKVQRKGFCYEGLCGWEVRYIYRELKQDK